MSAGSLQPWHLILAVIVIGILIRVIVLIVKKGTFLTGIKFSGGASAVAVVSFFLPWMLVSCAGQPTVTFSGWQLAAGIDIPNPFGSARHIPGDGAIFLVLLAALAGLVVAYLVFTRTMAPRTGGYFGIALGVVSLLVLLWKFSGYQSSVPAMVSVQPQIGLWLTVLANLGMAAGGVIALQGEQSPGTTTRTESPPKAAERQRGGSPLWAEPTDAGAEGPPVAVQQKSEQPPRYCMSCGKPLPDGARFCMFCGKQN